MSHNSQLYQWIDNVSTHFPNLSKAMVMGLALWSFGMVIALFRSFDCFDALGVANSPRLAAINQIML